MAYYENVDVVTLIAGEDLNDDQYKLLKINSSGRVILATAITDPIIGILAENPKQKGSSEVSTGKDVPVALLKGIVKVKALGAVTAGNLATWGTGALATEAASIAALGNDSFAFGVFLENGVANQIVSVLAGSFVGNT